MLNPIDNFRVVAPLSQDARFLAPQDFLLSQGQISGYNGTSYEFQFISSRPEQFNPFVATINGIGGQEIPQPYAPGQPLIPSHVLGG